MDDLSTDPVAGQYNLMSWAGPGTSVTHLLSPRAITGAVGPDYANAPDAELISAGNADAFAVVYDRHAAAVYRWARARVGDHAGDLMAETFARAWLSRGAFKDRAEGSAFPWLLGIAQNVLRDSMRRKRIEDKARARLGLPLQVASDPGYELVEERLSVPEAALKALADLPEPDRKVLDMRVVRAGPTTRSQHALSAPRSPRACGSHAHYAV